MIFAIKEHITVEQFKQIVKLPGLERCYTLDINRIVTTGNRLDPKWRYNMHPFATDGTIDGEWVPVFYFDHPVVANGKLYTLHGTHWTNLDWWVEPHTATERYVYPVDDPKSYAVVDWNRDINDLKIYETFNDCALAIPQLREIVYGKTKNVSSRTIKKRVNDIRKLLESL